MKELNTVDLFCGAGGATTGLELALQRIGMTHKGLAINHWNVAVDTMKRNHPAVDTKQMTIEEAVPAELVPGGVVDLLWASPSCTHHSRAKGGKPRSNQLRAQPDLILSWLDQLFVRRIIVENVPEFVDWGPLTKDGKPMESMKGSCFRAWVAAIEARNYTVEWRIVNCADYGDATSRRRFFLKAVRRGCGRICWPEPTHAENPQPDLFGNCPQKWRGVKECLDLADTGKSIFNRKDPLAYNTIRRIAIGAEKYWGVDIKPFIVRFNRNCDAESIDGPISCVTVKDHHALCTPIIIDHFRNGKAKSADEPIGAQTTHDRFSVVTPLVMGQQSGAMCKPTDKPCHTIATAGAIRVVTPIILDMSRPGGHDSGHIRTADKPIQTITTCDNVQVAMPKLADGRIIDIHLRMVKPSELAAAHSFPADYVLTGNRGEQVKQIGNSVPVMTAAAMCEADFAA